MAKVYFINKAKDQASKASEGVPATSDKKYSEDGFGSYHDK